MTNFAKFKILENTFLESKNLSGFDVMLTCTCTPLDKRE